MLAIAKRNRGALLGASGVEADDPEQNRFGCFLPDLTR
jgi:hypothetical protein